ncbi:MAG: tetratricopeptide repeat protein [Myxococcales bacterium]|nr:tetratricopeptide repeat protein [Myxococcales bacterium]
MLERVDAALRTTTGTVGSDVLRRVGAAVTTYRTAATSACRGAQGQRQLAPELAARSDACIAYRAQVAAAIIDDGALIARDLGAYASKVRALPSPTPCLDTVALAANPAAPGPEAVATRADLEVAIIDISVDQLDAAAALIERATPGAATDRATAAMLLRARGELAAARADYPTAVRLLADAYYAAQALDDAHVYLGALAMLVRVVGDIQANTGAAEPWVRLADAAVDRDRRRAPGEVVGLMLALAAAADRRGDGSTVLARTQQALVLSGETDEPMELAALEHSVANALAGAGRYPEAIDHERRGLAACVASLGPGHSTCLMFRATLALLLAESEQADAAMLEALAVQQELDAAPPSTLTAYADALVNVGNVLLDQAAYRDQAARDFRIARELYIGVHGPRHPDVARIESNLAVIDMKRGAWAEAAAALARSLAIQEEHLGPDHPDVAGTLFNLGTAQLRSGQLGPALAAARRAVAVFEAKSPGSSRHVYTLRMLAEILTRSGQAAEGEAAARRAFALAAAGGLATDNMAIEIARADVAQGRRLDEAARLLRAARPAFEPYPEVFAHQLAEIDALLAQLK